VDRTLAYAPPSSSVESLMVLRDSEEIRPWDSDHTALVHVLWAADSAGLTIEKFDDLASFIMRSKWMKAVRLHAKEST